MLYMSFKHLRLGGGSGPTESGRGVPQNRYWASDKNTNPGWATWDMDLGHVLYLEGLPETAVVGDVFSQRLQPVHLK